MKEKWRNLKIKQMYFWHLIRCHSPVTAVHTEMCNSSSVLCELAPPTALT